ncbi:MAG: coproporphyrinogen dehydrogenase HemZ [Tissierellia bacterium]|nr:coproporphyrinogen dehydrogenase HemZ [Tissierellia bacterium]
MIKVKSKRPGDAHAYFELLRIYYPTYEAEGADLVMTLVEEPDEDLVNVLFSDLGQVFFKSFKREDDPMDQRHKVARWLARDLKTDKKVPSKWGILTGTRPIKFAIKKGRGHSPEDLVDFLATDYLVDRDLADLLVAIAQLELKEVGALSKKDYGLYINIPFCPSRCSYCSYPTLVSYQEADQRTYLALLKKEMEGLFQEMAAYPAIIYIGGGTPTSLTTPLLGDLLDYIGSFSQGLENPEITLEAGRPDTLDREKMALISQSPVTRISINPQTMSNSVLKGVGRPHSKEDILRTYDMARNLGMDNINMDLILGLPGEDEAGFLDSLGQVIDLGPENITIHTLSFKNGSKLFEKTGIAIKNYSQLTNGAYALCKKNAYDPYYLYRQKRIIGNGENIGYAKAGHTCLYNMMMMEELATVIGVGMSSTSKIRTYGQGPGGEIKKFSNYRNYRDYTEKIDEIIKKKAYVLKEMGWTR